MAKDEISTRILHELEHMELGHRHSPQSLLRMLYSALRRKQLEQKLDSDPGISLIKALARTQKEYPDFVADFDTGFFAVEASAMPAGQSASEAFRVEREPGLRPGRIGATA